MTDVPTSRISAFAKRRASFRPKTKAIVQSWKNIPHKICRYSRYSHLVHRCQVIKNALQFVVFHAVADQYQLFQK